MNRKQVINKMSVAGWEFYKKYHAQVPLNDHIKELMAEDAMRISTEFGNERFIKRLLNIYCEELSEEKGE